MTLGDREECLYWPGGEWWSTDTYFSQSADDVVRVAKKHDLKWEW